MFFFFALPSRLIPHHFTCRNTPTLAGETLRQCQAFKWANTMCFFSDLINVPIKRKENWLPKGDFARAVLIKSGKHEWCVSWSAVTAASFLGGEAEASREYILTSNRRVRWRFRWTLSGYQPLGFFFFCHRLAAQWSCVKHAHKQKRRKVLLVSSACLKRLSIEYT